MWPRHVLWAWWGRHSDASRRGVPLHCSVSAGVPHAANARSIRLPEGRVEEVRCSCQRQLLTTVPHSPIPRETLNALPARQRA